ncbi:NADAR family protein [Streptomyces sp. NBC_01381]|uniref:NADAR family protein n=1 Tax=Streptomyces sp. NBC_01381 TaxID=2903845 RepID=UPI0022599300|nr:NADAR family protein [Streptomyces sp. NBC_01381]MCX4673364.1 NADAR family protein [Streptomyces sp. NBC_01381]
MDGQTIDGAWCHVWRRRPWDDRHVLDDLIVFADGAVKCEEWTDLPGLEKLLESGDIAVTEPGAPAAPAPPSKWRARYGEPLTPQGFLLEVADKVEELSGRPTAAQRCQEAIRHFQQDPSEPNRTVLREAYLAVPPHLRVFVLGDMDHQDRPLRILLTELGEAVDGDGPVATADMHQQALDYFNRLEQAVAQAQEQRAERYADDPAEAGQAAFTSLETVCPRGWPEALGPFVLRNEYPVPVEFAGETYPCVIHGYWALSAADPRDHDRIRDAPSVRDAREMGGRVERRADWPDVRLAVMEGLLEVKFTQNPELAQILLATGDSVISYTGLSDSPFWRDAGDGRGRNWVGRLLELTRARLVARRVFP